MSKLSLKETDMLKPTRPAICILGLALTVAACAPLTPEQTNNQGNERFAEQDYAGALDRYLNVSAGQPDLPAPYYNAANAYYRQSDYQAAQLYLMEAVNRGEASLDQVAFFNLGNVAYNIQQLEVAAENYRAALRINPDDEDAKHNLELTLQEIQRQQELEQQQQEEQQPEQDEQQEEEQQEEQPEQDEQEGAQDGEGEEEDGGTPTPDPESDQPQPTPEQPEDSQGEGEPTPEPSAEPSPAGQDEQSEQDGDSQGDEQSTPTPDPSGNQQTQGQPTGTPTVSPTMTPEASGAGQPPPQNAAGEQRLAMPEGGQQLTEEQARQLLTAIGRNTETLQERLQQIYVAPGGPPAQDW